MDTCRSLQISFIAVLINLFTCINIKPPLYVWKLVNLNTNEEINRTKVSSPDQWPELAFHLAKIVPLPHRDLPRIHSYGFYACPQNNNKQCGGPPSHYCAKWSCVTSNDGNWKWNTNKQDYIRLSWAFPWNTYVKYNTQNQDIIKITFTNSGKALSSDRWATGMVWGIEFYWRGWNNPGGLLQVQRIPLTPLSQPIGPNTILSKQLPTNPRPVPVTPSVISSFPPLNLPSRPRLLNLVQGAFQALNYSHPSLAQSCWLCLTTTPPYYEGFTLGERFSNQTDYRLCPWTSQAKLSLSAVSGFTGTCIGTPRNIQQAKLCNQTIKSPRTSNTYYLIPPAGGWWACNTGLRPCVATSVFNQSHDFCVMVRIVPRIVYHTEDNFLTQYQLPTTRFKREPISITLAVLLGLGVAAGVGTGTAALIEGPKQLQSLNLAVAEDLQAIELSISKLQDSLTSLSEVVLQNRRGLDLLFLKEGGLCAALKEQCCFYTDHSGVVKDSMAKLRERLNQRIRESETGSGLWNFNLPNTSWFTNLLLSFAGPFLGILLFLAFGPWAFKKITNLIKQQIDAVQAKPLQIHYHRLAVDETYAANNENPSFLPTGTA